MKDRLIINKALVPYKFGILLASNWFEIEVNYNVTADLFTVTLYKNNRMICAGEPIIYGTPLFADTYKIGFPALTIIPVDEAGNNNAVTFENFGETVFLCIYDDTDDTINYSSGTSSSYSPNTIDITVEVITAEQRLLMEAAIIAQGGTVVKAGEVATFAELTTAISTISGGQPQPQPQPTDFATIIAHNITGSVIGTPTIIEEVQE